MSAADHTEVRTPRRGKITVAQVRAVLEEIAATEPDRRDRRAGLLPPRYVDQGQPNCLVALVLERLGISLGVLRQLDQEHPTGEIVHAGVRVAESRNPSLRRFDRAALDLLDHVQRQQDAGRTWGSIVCDAFNRTRFTPDWYDRRRRPWLFADNS